MIGNFSNIMRIPELRRRLIFTLTALFIYRIGIFITLPGIDRTKLINFSQGLLGLFNLFSGGALERMSIFALGVMPYISASIILQLLTVVVPTIAQLNKEGELGRQKINQYTRYGTVIISVLQGIGIAIWLSSQNASRPGLIIYSNTTFIIITVVTLVTGAVFLMWLGEQMTERGVGNGISLLIYAGIIASIPSALRSTFDIYGNKPVSLLILTAFMILVIAFIAFFERAHRRIPIQYAKRATGDNQLVGGQASHLPLKVNSAGVIPPIFASSILMFPATLSSWIPQLRPISAYLNIDSVLYNVIYVILIIFFCFFYTAVTFNPIDVADNIKKYGGYIPGIRPGQQTAEYIDKVLSRITVGGALYVSAVCVLPNIMIAKYGVPFYFGGTSLMIVVGVALEFVQQIESYLITRHYEGLAGPQRLKIKGRRSTVA